MTNALRANKFDVVALSSIVSERNLKKHPLMQPDRHPSPAANQAIGAYLWEQVGERLLAAHSKALRQVTFFAAARHYNGSGALSAN
jgi:hypothetical protein